MTHTRTWTASLLLVIAAQTSGCSLLLASDAPACRSNADCASHAQDAICSQGLCMPGQRLEPRVGEEADSASSDPTWGCIGRVSWPAEDPSRTVRLTGELRQLVTQSPLAGFTVKSCSGIDVLCENPRATALTDADGRYALVESSGFRGFLQVEPVLGSKALPTVVEAKPPPFTDTDYGSGTHALMIPTPDSLQALVQIVEQELDPEAGHFFGMAVDCQNRPARGISLHANTTLSTSLDYYTDDSGLPARGLRETSGNGEAGFVNLKPGPVTLTYSLASRRVGSITVQVRKGGLTAAFLPPSPLD